MKIKSIKIHNFRSIKEMIFNPYEYSVMLGANNAGKTNVITALRIFYEDDIKYIKNSDFPKFKTDDDESWIDIEYLLTDDEFKNLYPIDIIPLLIVILLLSSPFVRVSVVPSICTVVVKNSAILAFYNGKTLYVGISRPGNYTKIQNVIDYASDGDTVFIYDDSSQYYENIVLDYSTHF